MIGERGAPPLPNTLPIGVFDSGIGGLSVLQALRAEMPAERFVYLADSGFAPYGERGEAFVTARTQAIADHLVQEHQVKALVIACNTATAAAVHAVRARFPGMAVVGVEPALKPALALSQTGCIGVMATRGTVGSAKFQALLQSVQASQAGHTPPARFVVQACDGLAAAIEQAAQHPSVESTTKIRALCEAYTRALGQFGSQKSEIDTLVLGCTHYVFARPVLQALLGPSIHLLDNGPAVARHTHRLLKAAALAAPEAETAPRPMLANDWLQACTTGDPLSLHGALRTWLGLHDAAEPSPLLLPLKP